MKKRYIIFIIIILVICIAIEGLVIYKNTETKFESDLKNTQEENEEINSIKQETGAYGDSGLYMVGEEYDGRRALVIKPTIQYKIIMAGILKGDKPEFSDIDDLENKFPKKNGIWISERGRERFLQLMKSISDSEYYIDKDGYLQCDNKENILNEIIEGDNCITIDISENLYIVDEMTGEVVEYPFELMDPYQTYEKYGADNKSVYIVTTNQSNKLNDNDIIKELIQDIKG